jgi:hypothetical protein
MCDEGVMIPRGKRRHPRAFRVALMLEEDREVGVDDVAQNHIHAFNGEDHPGASNCSACKEKVIAGFAACNR